MGPDVQAVLEAVGDCSVERCVMDAEFLKDAGFVVVAPHTYFPRLRLELDKGLGWKAEVEAALERLLESAHLEQPVGAGSTAGNALGPPWVVEGLRTAQLAGALHRQFVGQ